MAKSITSLVIFISGTSETEAERAALRHVAEKLNNRLEKTHNITLRIVGWPDSVRPGVNSDPQMEINQQIGANYDIYLGILGARFGSSTPRFESGTEEEFESALSAFKQDTQKVRLLFYFKKQSADLFKINIDQLAKVQKFRQDLGVKGVLYRDFVDTAEFVDQVDEALYHLIVDQWKGDKWAAVNLADAEFSGTVPKSINEENSARKASEHGQLCSEESTSSQEVDEQNELGYLEVLSEYERSMEVLTGSLAKITEHSGSMGGKFKQRSQEAEALTTELRAQNKNLISKERTSLLMKVRNAIDAAAGDIDGYSDDMTREIGTMKVATRSMFGALRQSLALGEQISPNSEKKEELRSSLVGMIDAIKGAQAATSTLQESIGSMPSMTGKIIRSRKRATTMLGELIAEFSYILKEANLLVSDMGGSSDASEVST